MSISKGKNSSGEACIEAEKPRVFIGSSTRSLPLARALESLLTECLDVRVWKDRFKPGSVTFEQLIAESRDNEFAIFIFSPDDVVRPIEKRPKRGLRKAKNYRRVRDNVVFEAGLFLGRLGRSRTLIVAEKTASLASDFLGLTMVAEYEWNGNRHHARNAMLVPADSIRAWVQKFALIGEKLRLAAELSWEISDKLLVPFHSAKRSRRLDIVQGLLEDMVKETEHTLGVGAAGHAGQFIELEKSDYDKDLSEARTYLTRASRLFGSAETVYAVSLDLASPFWLATDERRRRLADKYRSEQEGKSVHRLFVFTNARAAAEHRWVLRDHFDSYGKQGKERGGVYLCSFAEYQKLLDSVFTSESRRRKFTYSDFALLTFEPSRKGQPRRCFGSLGNGRFKFEEIEDGSRDWEALLDWWHKLIALEPGQQLQDFRFRRWDENFGYHNRHWQDALSAVFETVRPFGVAETLWETSEEGDVLHLVFLKDHEKKRLAEKLTRVSDRLLQLRDTRVESLVRSVWFGRSTDALRQMDVKDGRFGGPLRVSSDHVLDFPYCLLVHLHGLEMLKLYYEHTEHSDIRKEVLMAICPEVFGPLFETLEEAPTSEHCSRYAEIEKQAMHFMFRADYIRDEHLGTLIDKVRDPRGLARPE